jgi:hypothetical protein
MLMVLAQCSIRPVTMITSRMARVVLMVAGTIDAMWFILMPTAHKSFMMHDIY